MFYVTHLPDNAERSHVAARVRARRDAIRESRRAVKNRGGGYAAVYRLNEPASVEEYRCKWNPQLGKIEVLYDAKAAATATV